MAAPNGIRQAFRQVYAEQIGLHRAANAVYATDSKSPGATRPGSIPGSGTISFSAMDFVARFRIQFRADSAKRLSYALTKGIYRR
jgi:hypothetical protein